MPKLSIIIITLNESSHIGHLLTDLSQQSYQNFEVIIVDSNSEDDTCEVAAHFNAKLPKLNIHVMSERGVSLGRNTGASLATAERLLFLDADVRLPTDFLSTAMTKLNNSGLEIAGIYLGSEGLPIHYKVGYWSINLGMFLTQFVFPTAVGACLFSSRRIHKQLNGFDESIVLCEDCEYAKRAARTWRFRFLPITFQFDPRRLVQDGLFKTGLTYLRANTRRLFFGEMRNNEIDYQFGHYGKMGNNAPQSLWKKLLNYFRSTT